MNVTEAFRNLRKTDNAFLDGEASGDDLHSALVDYTDALYMAGGWPTGELPPKIPDEENNALRNVSHRCPHAS